MRLGRVRTCQAAKARLADQWQQLLPQLPALRFGPSPKLEGEEGAWRLTLAGCRLKFPGFVPCTKVL